ncbi:MAG: outer membrane beta-barrel protein [Candidatus Omnitrophota bacterium]|nr:MAG: outer membrane beta-barrel protein [Candidatus Omnitrophota bacterium]
MKGVLVVLLSLFLTGIFFCEEVVFSQVKEEREEEGFEEQRLPEEPLPYKLSSKVTLLSGYDSNVRLTTIRKGDFFEQFIYSLDFTKPITSDLKLRFDYDFDVLNYHEVTDLSNLLNHLRLGVHNQFALCTIGTGYDLGIAYYPRNKDGNFLFHKGFTYADYTLFDSQYHRVQFEYGLKDYTHNNSLGDFIFARQDKERLDRRLSAGYSIGSFLAPQLFLQFRTKFSVNNSNARFEDFYDYKSYKQTVSLTYKLLKDLYLLSDFSYTRKLYSARTVTIGADKQRDNLFVFNTDFLYRLDKNQSLLLRYTYRNNSSNDDLAEYSENMITCGWQYKF